MNFRTTWLLLMVLGLLVLGYLALRSQPDTETDLADRSSMMGGSVVSQDLLGEQDKLEELVQVVCRTKDNEEWVFEAEAKTEDAPGGSATWRMTAPLDMAVTGWQIERFRTQLNNLSYEISYKPGEPGGVTAQAAGLQPPEVVVTATDKNDHTLSVEIGRNAGAGKTYIRLVGREDVCVAKADLTSLVKDSAIEYRDPQLWDFRPADATRVDIVERTEDGKSVHYAVARHDGRWMIEQPVTARATSKVDDMIQAMARIRAIKWHESSPDRLGVFGLEPPRCTIRATVEQEVEIAKSDASTAGEDAAELEGEDDDGDGPPEPTTRIETTVYELHLSDRSPIGEDTKVYISPGGEPAVGTIMKSVADKLTPDLSKWRDMSVTTVAATTATRVEVATDEGDAVLVKPGVNWAFEQDGAPAERSAVVDLLSAIDKLEAVAFVESTDDDLARFGVDSPRATVRLTMPGVEDVERIAVGAYTDPQTRRLVYVRRNEMLSIAKVRADDVAPLLRGPIAYRDRTIVDIGAGKIERIELSTKNRFAPGRIELTFQPDEDDAWAITAPVSATVKRETFPKLVGALRNVNATSIVADATELTAFGLDAPDAVLTLTYAPQVEYRFEEGDEHATEVQPPSKMVTLSVAKHGGKVYAKRGDDPVVYELTPDLHRMLLDSYRSDEVLSFDAEKVVRFSIRSGDVEHSFERRGEDWIYRAEPDLPLDAQKVENLLLQLGDLRSSGCVHHTVPSDESLQAMGLATPHDDITVALDDGKQIRLRVSQQACATEPTVGRYATSDTTAGVFLLPTDAVKRYTVSLSELETR